MGRIIRCITTDGLIIGAAIDSTDIVRRAQEIHNSSPVVTTALGRLLTGASIMGNRLKEEQGSLTLRVEGNGPAGALIAVSDSTGNVRGLAGNPQAETGDVIDVGAVVGHEGLLGVIKDFGEGEPYTAQIPLVSGEIAEDLTSYYAVSEQTPTVLMLGVHHGDDGIVDHAGGLLIQLLPLADDREIEVLERNLKDIPKLTKMLQDGMSLEDILSRALEGFELEFFDETEVKYECKCSREKVESALISLGIKELVSLSNSGENTEICCHFCDKKYYFSPIELLRLAKEIKDKKIQNNG